MPHELPTELLRGTTCEGLFTCLAEWAYRVTDGWFFAIFLLGFAVVLFMATQRFGVARSFGFSSSIMIFGTIIFLTLELMAAWVGTIFILLGILGVVVMILINRTD